MITKTVKVKITIDDQNVEELYPNYRFNFDSAKEFLEYLMHNLNTPDTDDYSGEFINHLKVWGYEIEVLED